MGRSRLAGLLVLGLAIAGALATGWWSLPLERVGARQALAAGALCFTTAWATLAWRHSPTGELIWNGRVWTWSNGAAATEVAVVVGLDLQFALLAHVQAIPAQSSRRVWLWLERGAHPAAWRALRRAVYSRARPEALPDAMPPPAQP